MHSVVAPEERPSASYYGTLTTCDSHPVNTLMLKHMRAVLPDTDVVLPSFCIQHHAGRAATDVAVDLNLFTRTWCLAKTFSEGDFHTDLEAHIDDILEHGEVGLEIVDPEEFELAPNDLTRDFTQAIMDRCYKSDLESGAADLSDRGERRPLARSPDGDGPQDQGPQ